MQAHAIPAFVGIIALISGCSLGSEVDSGGSPAPSTPTATAAARYNGNGIAFTYPAAWRYHRPGLVTTMTDGFIDLSTQPMGIPCRSNGCSWPLARLRPGGVLVAWATGGATTREEVRRPGLKVKVSRPRGCSALGGDETLTAWIITANHRKFVVDACLREPGVPANELAVRAMLASAR